MSEDGRACLQSRRPHWSCKAAPVWKSVLGSFWPPPDKVDGNWRLVTLDFGVEAQRHECEFLMCFALQPVNGELSVTSSYVEIGFSLKVPIRDDPVFVLSVKTAAESPP